MTTAGLPASGSVSWRRPGRWHLAAAVAAIAGYDILRTVIPDDWHFATNVAFAAAMLAGACAVGCGAADLGLSRADLGSGALWGLGSAAVIGGVIALAAAIPATRGWFEDDNSATGVGEMVLRAAITIPIGTAVVEEIVFRSVLLATSLAALALPAAVAVGSVVFGLWHIPPIVDDGLGAVAGTVVFTTVAGVLFIVLRLISRSVLAPTMAHVATNSGALIASWAVSR